MATLLKINGVTMPTPTQWGVGKQDIDSEKTGRSETGVMYRDRVRQGVVKVEATWEMLTEAELELIINAVKPSKFSATIYDGATRTLQMYAGDRKTELTAHLSDGTRWQLALSLVEY